MPEARIADLAGREGQRVLRTILLIVILPAVLGMSLALVAFKLFVH